MALEIALNWQITGHSRQLGLLERALSGDRLSHAYVFAGPAQSGKRTVAKRLAQILLCDAGTACGECANCKTLSAGSNADYIEISAGETIKIEAVRGLSYKMSLKPYGGKYKIAVIDDAHNLTTEAANGLLKMLEEPKPQTMMVLVTNNPHKLLPTILSRAQKISFGPLESGAINTSEDVQEQERQSCESFQQFMGASAGGRLVLAAELAEQETPDIKNTINSWLGYMQINLREDPSTDTVQRIKGLMRAQRLLEQNVNTKLLLSELMVAIN